VDAKPVDPDSGLPPYQQVTNDLKARIDAGALTGRLPTEIDLAAGYGVAHGTVRKALALLREAGYIETSPGWGSRVRAPGERGG
jgi:DNA-binding GntR family transcriptional regulator